MQTLNFMGFFAKFFRKININKFFFNVLLYKNLRLIDHGILPSAFVAQKKLEMIYPKKKFTINSNNYYNSPQFDLTIIIAAHNAEKTISDTINSVFKQKTKYRWILKIINDGSTDNTQAEMDKYKYDNRVELIKQPCLGVSAARNKGLKLIDSRYVMFLDSDDLLDDHSIENLISCAEMTNSDIVQGSFSYFKNNVNRIKYQKKYSNYSTCIKDDFTDYVSGYPWGKIYRSTFFLNIVFPVNYVFEDTMIYFLILPQASRVSSIEETTYFYRINNNGITKRARFSNYVLDSIWITLSLLEEALKVQHYNRNFMYKIFMMQTVMNFRRTELFNREIRKCIFVLSRNMYLKYFDEFNFKIDEFYKLNLAYKNNDFVSYECYCYFV